MSNTRLRYRQSRDIKKVFTSVVNKIFALNSEWANDGVEVVSVSGDNSPKAYEQFPWNNEKYPIVVLFSQGSNSDMWAIDSFISNHTQSLTAGSTPSSWVQLSSTPVATGFRLEQGAMTLKSSNILVQNIGPYEEDILLNIWDESSGMPSTILTGGTIRGKKTSGIEWVHAQIAPEITLAQNTNYFLSAETAQISGSPLGSYYWFTDNNVDTQITPYSWQGIKSTSSWTMTSSISPIAQLFGPSVKRLGGGAQTSIRMFIEAKDLSTVQKISELLFVYLHLARHSNANRSAKLSNPNITATDFDFVSDLSDEGIYIVDISKGAETVRVRGNDRLFSTDLTLTCYSHWTEDFVFPVLESLDFDFSSI